MPEATGCCICSQILGDSSNDLIAEMLRQEPYIRRIPIENSVFAVIPSLGALVPGHVLLCPKTHYRSFSVLPDESQESFDNLKERLTRLLRDLYGSPVHFFEHGMAREGQRILCTVEHAHLHAVPTFVSVWERLKSRGLWEAVGTGLKNLKNAVGDGEYLYYESPEGSRHVNKVQGGEFESQYLRRVFAEALDHPENWNWREFPSAATTHKMFELMRDASQALPMVLDCAQDISQRRNTSIPSLAPRKNLGPRY